MRKFLFYILVSLVLSTNAYAIPCDFILNQDLKHICLALKEKSITECNFVQDNDFKYGCLAEVTKRSSYCDFIKDNDLKYLCKVRSEL
jgi:hypothetical protein